VRINLSGLKDDALSSSFGEKVQGIMAASEAEFKRVNAIVESKLG
jgi:formiminotetrahydrofolate cyclodeaminase